FGSSRVRLSRADARRAREREIPGRALLAVHSSDVSRKGVRPRDRVQEVLHGRMERRAGPRAGRHDPPRAGIGRAGTARGTGAIVSRHQPTAEPVPDDLTAAVVARLEGDLRVWRRLPGGGRLSIDRRLPFLCVHRLPPGGGGDAGTQELVTGESAYLIAPSEA